MEPLETKEGLQDCYKQLFETKNVVRLPFLEQSRLCRAICSQCYKWSKVTRQ